MKHQLIQTDHIIEDKRFAESQDQRILEVTYINATLITSSVI